MAQSALSTRSTAKAKQQELEQLSGQAKTQLYVDHVNQRREHRRATYLTFVQAVAALSRLTREDRHRAAKLAGRTEEYGVELSDAASAIEAARDTVMLDGPHYVAEEAAELCRLPYRVAGAALAAHEHALDSPEWATATGQMDDLRTQMIKKCTRFSVAGSSAINMDGVGNHTEPAPWSTPATPPGAGQQRQGPRA
ncbi:hypothetical protein OG384_04505 [Streptomyces sp. NBC_01324]|uniref:hypothetical protein n=1 Tax=Streptomyces sp. NBC_01324 TaxID=2903826 RepID=UPI002E11A284|nr:hypothetical protein OG384_04505 [Streptomyces sp. NBC_01324]